MFSGTSESRKKRDSERHADNEDDNEDRDHCEFDCDDEYAPICVTDHERFSTIYSNECEFERALCRQPDLGQLPLEIAPEEVCHNGGLGMYGICTLGKIIVRIYGIEGYN